MKDIFCNKCMDIKFKLYSGPRKFSLRVIEILGWKIQILIYFTRQSRTNQILDQRESRTNCQLSNLPTNSLVSSDLEYTPGWVIYEKLDGKECNTAILLHQPPDRTEDKGNDNAFTWYE